MTESEHKEVMSEFKALIEAASGECDGISIKHDPSLARNFEWLRDSYLELYENSIKRSVDFTVKELDEIRKFQNRLTKEFGEATYVGTDYATVMLEYSPELKAMIRPMPNEKHYDFDLKHLSCRDCKKKALFLCLPAQKDFVCDDCLTKRKKQG